MLPLRLACLATIVATTGCALDFDHYLDGAVASDAPAIDVPTDSALPDASCATPWLLVAVPSGDRTALLRYSVASNGDLNQCVPFTGVDSDLIAFTMRSRTTIATVTPSGVANLDIATHSLTSIRAHASMGTAIGAFHIETSTSHGIGVVYQRSGAISGMRIFDLDSASSGFVDWTPAQAPDVGTVRAITSHPTIPTRMVLAAASGSAYEIDPVVGPNVPSAFRDSIGTNISAAHGVRRAGVAFASSSDQSVRLATTQSNDVAGPVVCPSDCTTGAPIDAVPNPNRPGSAIVVCHRNGMIRVLTADGAGCEVAREAPSADTDPVRIDVFTDDV